MVVVLNQKLPTINVLDGLFQFLVCSSDKITEKKHG